MRQRLIVLSLLCLICSSPKAASPVILILGDSLSASYDIDPARGWPQLLQKRLDQQLLDYRVVNISISGETTYGGLRRLPAALDKYGPAVVIIELGGNDGLRGLSLEIMKKNLASMITHAKQKAARVLLIGMRIPPNYGNFYITKFHAIYHELAETYRISLLPFLLTYVAGDPKLMQEDGIHPKTQAQPIIVNNVWPVLLPMLNLKTSNPLSLSSLILFAQRQG